MVGLLAGWSAMSSSSPLFLVTGARVLLEDSGDTACALLNDEDHV
jgi:hypothetical protein